MQRQTNAKTTMHGTDPIILDVGMTCVQHTHELTKADEQQVDQKIVRYQYPVAVAEKSRSSRTLIQGG